MMIDFKYIGEIFQEVYTTQWSMTDCMNKLADLRKQTDTNDFRKLNYDVAALVILAGYRALAIEDGHVIAKINTSSGYDYMDGVLTINEDKYEDEDKEYETFVSILCVDSNEEYEKKAEYVIRDSLLAPELTAQGHEVRYCVLNYNYWNYDHWHGIGDMTYEEAKDCTYDFLYHNDKPEERHSVRIEKMFQLYEYKHEHDWFIAFNIFITSILNYICDSSEKRECVNIEKINGELYVAMRFLKAEKHVLKIEKEAGDLKKKH